MILIPNKLLGLIISIGLIIANSIALIHHHEDVKQHTDCQVCVLQLNQQSEDPNSLEFSFEIQTRENDFPLIIKNPVLQSKKTSYKNPRAPPALKFV